MWGIEANTLKNDSEEVAEEQLRCQTVSGMQDKSLPVGRIVNRIMTKNI